MCTVTYLPRPSGFILTHNRDEAPSRSPQSIVREAKSDGNTLLFPRDIKAGGTWIATSRQGRTACLLNGAFVKHHHQPPYRRSRGLILLDFFEWEQPDDFFQQYDLEGVEPFTMLFFAQEKHFESSNISESSIPRVSEFRWDGQQRFFTPLPSNEAHFWCSSTLYPPAMQARREQVFRDWLAQSPHHSITQSLHPSITPSLHHSIISLHRTGSVGDPENDYVMDRAGKVRTVSLTQVIVDEKNARMRYFDLLEGNHSERWLRQSKRTAMTVNR